MANAMQCVGVFTGMRYPSHAGVFLGWVSLPFPVFTRCVNCESTYHGFKNPRLFAFGLPSFRRHLLDAPFLPRVQEPAAIRLRPRVFQTPLSCHTIIKAVWKTRTFKPVEYGSIHHQGRLEDGNMNIRRAFKPPGWSQTQHIMASGRREVK